MKLAYSLFFAYIQEINVSSVSLSESEMLSVGVGQ
jgi:hypothetical protein